MKETNSRDEWLVEMRPELKIEKEASLPNEQFQNTTLRPILKFQNALLIRLFKDYLQHRKKNFSLLNQSAQKQLIKDVVQHDHGFRKELIHTIVAFFTEHELNTYLSKRSEFNKRIAQMMEQRLVDQLERLV